MAEWLWLVWFMLASADSPPSSRKHFLTLLVCGFGGWRGAGCASQAAADSGKLEGTQYAGNGPAGNSTLTITANVRQKSRRHRRFAIDDLRQADFGEVSKTRGESWMIKTSPLAA